MTPIPIPISPCKSVIKRTIEQPFGNTSFEEEFDLSLYLSNNQRTPVKKKVSDQFEGPLLEDTTNTMNNLVNNHLNENAVDNDNVKKE